MSDDDSAKTWVDGSNEMWWIDAEGWVRPPAGHEDWSAERSHAWSMLTLSPADGCVLPEWFRRTIFKFLDTLTPDCAIALFCLTRDRFTRRDLAHLLQLVSGMIEKRAEADEPIRAPEAPEEDIAAGLACLVPDVFARIHRAVLSEARRRL
jgi:hypothetical protein